MSVDERLRTVFSAVFGIDVTSLSDDSSPATIPAWDSVAHIQLVLAIEAEFGIEFDPTEIGELVLLGDVRNRIEARHV